MATLRGASAHLAEFHPWTSITRMCTGVRSELADSEPCGARRFVLLLPAKPQLRPTHRSCLASRSMATDRHPAGVINSPNDPPAETEIVYMQYAFYFAQQALLGLT